MRTEVSNGRIRVPFTFNLRISILSVGLELSLEFFWRRKFLKKKISMKRYGIKDTVRSMIVSMTMKNYR